MKNGSRLIKFLVNNIYIFKLIYYKNTFYN